jgi:hypothetical protein
MNAFEAAGVGYFKVWLGRSISAHDAEHYGKAITQFNVKDEGGIVWIHAEVELTTLPEGNLLKCLDHEWWFVQVGKRGALTAHQYPRHYAQFAGGKKHWSGMKFKGKKPKASRVAKPQLTKEESIAAMKKWALDNYDTGGDTVVECWGDAEWNEHWEEYPTHAKAFKELKYLCKLWKEHGDEIRATAF